MGHFSKKNESYCPFWIECNSQCMRRLGGLFIPLPYYADQFCKTGQFTNCGHYLLGNLLTMERSESLANAYNS